MNNPAFHLDQQFITDLWERINNTAAAATPLAGFIKAHSVGQIPSKQHLAALLDAVFWTSFDKEEGSSVSVSLIFRQPVGGSDTFCFDHPMPLASKSLTKLGPALENPRAHISVWPDESGQLKIWGFRTGSDDFISSELWVQDLGPGCVLISYGGRSLAALTGNKAVFVDPGILMKAVLPRITPRSPQSNPSPIGILRYNSLLYIAQAMRTHGHGGTVLVVPEESSWQQSIRLPAPYTGGASFLDASVDLLTSSSDQLATQKSFFDFIKKRIMTKRQDKFTRTREKIQQQCSRIARLTAVDGALVMTQDRYTYCFGAKIQAVEPMPSSFTVQVLKPIEGYARTAMNISDLGGMRHQSAVQFAYDQPRAVAIVASQDGDVTFFTQESLTGKVLAVQQAELALLHEGLSGALWNISLFSQMESLE